MNVSDLMVFSASIHSINFEQIGWGFMVLYIGPETILPITSFLAGLLGALLMFWRYVVGVVRKGFRFCNRTVLKALGKPLPQEPIESHSDGQG